MNFKKKEAYRIDEENLRLIERITQAHSTIGLKQMEEDY